MGRRRPDLPKHIADELQAASLADLVRRKGLTHLRVRRHGVLLIVESGPNDDPIPHLRFRRLGAHIWRVEMPTHSDGWEVTPLRGPIEKLLDYVVAELPWTLTAFE
jgi:hypothetical protein